MKMSSLAELAEQPVSHDPQLMKKVMIKNGEVPHLTGFSQATIPVNGTVTSHQHNDMYEVFLVSSGQCAMTINSVEYQLNEGSCVVIEPTEEHSLKNNGATDLILTYFGLVK